MDRAARLALAAPTPGPLARLLAALALGRSRQGLARLDARLLRDVGLSREEALREARRRAWDGIEERPWNVPAHWLR